MVRLISQLKLTTLLTLFLSYLLVAFALSWIPFIPGFLVIGLTIFIVNLFFLLSLFNPRDRSWSKRMLLHSALILVFVIAYAFFPGLPLSTKSTVKLVGVEGGQVMTPDRMARVVVEPASSAIPLLLKVTSLPLDIPLPDTLPPEVKLIAAARFEQSHPFSEEWRNFFLPEVQLSLKNAVAPVEGGGYFTEICFWVSPEEMIYPHERGSWFCEGAYDIRSGDPTQKGSGWVATTIKGFGPEGTTFYLFQYPRSWARANCEAAGGRFDGSPYIRGFGDACSYWNTDYDVTLGRVVHNPLPENPNPTRRQP